MSVLINTNSAATLAANNLAASNSLLQRSLNRLSSGSKIVNPADDAGGLAVSMKLSATARRQGAAMTNLGNSTSYLQSQDGVLKTAGKVLERIGELKTLASDPTKNATDLANYDAEFTALQDELTSLAGETFNGIALFGSTSLSVGATADSGGSTIAIGGTDLTGSVPITPTWSDISGATPGADWTASAGGISSSGGYTRFHADGTLTTTQSNISGPYTISFTMDSVGFGSGIISLSGGGSGSLDLKAIPGAMDASDHAMVVTVDASGNAAWSMDGGAQTGTVSNFASLSGGAITFSQTDNAGGNDLHLKDDFTLTSTAGSSGTTDYSSVISATSLSALGLSDVTSALQEIATFRADNGAQQSRLGFAAEVLATNKANLEAANSRIIDVDVAEESTSLARYNILVQAGTSMLAQANQSAQSALRLIG